MAKALGFSFGGYTLLKTGTLTAYQQAVDLMLETLGRKSLTQMAEEADAVVASILNDAISRADDLERQMISLQTRYVAAQSDVAAANAKREMIALLLP